MILDTSRESESLEFRAALTDVNVHISGYKQSVA